MKALKTIIGALVVVGAASFSAPSQAAMAYRTVINHASAVCTGTTPYNQNMLRIRAMGISNSSSILASVNCGGVATPFNTDGGDVLMFEAGLLNRGTVSVTVNCMLEDGVQDGTVTIATQYPKSITLPAGAPGWFYWSRGAENGGKNFMYPSMSCQLPSQVEISYTAIVHQVDVGL